MKRRKHVIRINWEDIDREFGSIHFDIYITRERFILKFTCTNVLKIFLIIELDDIKIFSITFNAPLLNRFIKIEMNLLSWILNNFNITKLLLIFIDDEMCITSSKKKKLRLYRRNWNLRNKN